MDLPSNTTAVFNPILTIEKKEGEEYNEMKVDYTCPGANNTESIDDCMLTAEDFGAEFATPETEGDGTKYYGRAGREFRIKKGLSAGTYRITVSLVSGLESSCEYETSTNSFEVKVHEIKSPRIGLARVNCENIQANCTVTDTVMDNWTTKYDATTAPNGNKEIDFFERFFPVPENNSNPYFRETQYKAEAPKRTLIDKIVNLFSPDILDSEKRKYRRIILNALQARTLGKHKTTNRYDYLVGVGSGVFFTDNSQGLDSPDDYGVAFPGLSAPFNKIGFVRDKDKNNKSLLNSGTLLHELGHLLGQRKEFYGFKDNNSNFLPDDQQYQCTAHDLKIREQDGSFDKNDYPCYQFPFPNQSKYANYGFKNSQYIFKSKSIMGGSTDLNEQAMDRDTYITTFNHLKDPAKDPKITLISGIYAKGKNVLMLV